MWLVVVVKQAAITRREIRIINKKHSNLYIYIKTIEHFITLNSIYVDIILFPMVPCALPICSPHVPNTFRMWLSNEHHISLTNSIAWYCTHHL